MNFQVDHSLTTFSSKGKLSQCDNAMCAANNGSLTVAITSRDGTILVSLKNLPKLIESEKVFKVIKISNNIGMSYSGLYPDFRILTKKAHKLAQEYKNTFGRYPYVNTFVVHFSRIIQEYTQQGGYRPFGVVLLIVGTTREGTAVYQIDSYGSYSTYSIITHGKYSAEAKVQIEKRVENVDDNIISCIKVMQEYGGKEIQPKDVDIGVVYNSVREFKRLNAEEVKEIFESM